MAIGTVEVTHDVSHALILAGATLANPPAWTNPFAQITSVKVAGNWTASSVSAGAQPGTNGYGVGDTAAPQKVADPSIPAGHYSKIGSITITGTVDGGAVGDQYGFVAANFGTITVSGQKLVPLAAGASTDITTGGGGEVMVHRLP